MRKNALIIASLCVLLAACTPEQQSQGKKDVVALNPSTKQWEATETVTFVGYLDGCRLYKIESGARVHYVTTCHD